MTTTATITAAAACWILILDKLYPWETRGCFVARILNALLKKRTEGKMKEIKENDFECELDRDWLKNI